MRFFAISVFMTCCGASIGDAPNDPPLKIHVVGGHAATAAVVAETDTAAIRKRAHDDRVLIPADLNARRTTDRIDCLKDGYEMFIVNIAGDAKHRTVTMSDGTVLVWDDGEEKAFTRKLEAPDLEDQLSIAYPRGPLSTSPKENADPGRIRVDAFFKAVYGADKKAVRARLVKIPWLRHRVGKTVVFNKTNGAAAALSRVSDALDAALPDALLTYVDNPSGTFNWRTIAGTRRLSAHAYGIAVDINVKQSHYWRWEKPRDLIYKNKIPYAIVEIFERHGFVWGGKWYHFDTMHFEYRPELLDERCLGPVD